MFLRLFHSLHVERTNTFASAHQSVIESSSNLCKFRGSSRCRRLLCFRLKNQTYLSICSGFVHQVMDNAVPNMSSAGGQQQVWRAQFSSLAPVDLKRAMANLGSPNKDMSDSVDARADTWIWVYSGLNFLFLF